MWITLSDRIRIVRKKLLKKASMHVLQSLYKLERHFFLAYKKARLVDEKQINKKYP